LISFFFFGTISTNHEKINYHSQIVKNIQKAAIKMIHSKTRLAIFQRAYMLLLLCDSMCVVQKALLGSNTIASSNT